MKKIYSILLLVALLLSFSNCNNDDVQQNDVPTFGQTHDNSFYYKGTETRSYSYLNVYPTSIDKSEQRYDENAYHFQIEDNSGNYKVKITMSSRNIDRIVNLANPEADSTTFNDFLSISLEEGYSSPGRVLFKYDIYNKKLSSAINGIELGDNQNCFVEGKIGTAMLDTCIIIEMSGKLRNNDDIAIKAQIDKKNFNANLIDPYFGLITDNQMIINDEIININEVSTDTTKIQTKDKRFNITYDFKLKAKSKTSTYELEFITNDTLLNTTIDLSKIEEFNYGRYYLKYSEINVEGDTIISFGINNDSISYNERLNFGYIKDSSSTKQYINIFQQGCIKLSVSPSGCSFLMAATLANNKKYVINGLDTRY